jgi:hypothetical protein
MLTTVERAFDERYRQWAQRSDELFAEASRVIPGGAGSGARTVSDLLNKAQEAFTVIRRTPQRRSSGLLA